MKYIYAIYPPSLMALISIVMTLLHVVFIVAVVIFIGDAICRLVEYIKIKDKPYTIELAHKYRKSWCGRTIIKTAFPNAKYYYLGMGYRWYHIFPDGGVKTFTKPKFWRSIFTIR